MTQVQLAKRLKTGQPAISRVEKGDVANIRFAERWAEACGYRLRFNHISMENKNSKLVGFTDSSEEL